jgi:hypothetical protein
MGCGCGSVTIPTVNAQNMVAPAYVVTEEEALECPYTKEQAALWLTKVTCIKDGSHYTEIPNMTTFQLNMYIGVLLSVEHYKGSPCYYQKELEEIESFILTITNLNLPC